MSIGLTNYLLTNKSDEGYILCTQQHSFLKTARERTLSKDLLALWLSQDRIYAAHAYPRFISGLISKIPFSSQHRLDSEEEKKNQRLLSVLTSCLENVVREASFFMASAKKYDLDLSSWKERLATRSYTAEMARISTWGSLEEGLVFLWAMEKVYLDAWDFVAGGKGGTNTESTAVTSAIDAFAENWSSSDFVKFVDDLRELVDGLEIVPSTDAWSRSVMVWNRVIELEIDFWPEAEEIQVSRSRHA